MVQKQLDRPSPAASARSSRLTAQPHPIPLEWRVPCRPHSSEPAFTYPVSPMRHVLLLLMTVPGTLAIAEPPSQEEIASADQNKTEFLSQQERTELAFFEKRIRPVLVEHCYECHSENADDIGGNLLLDSKDGTLAGGHTGPAIVAGNVADSLLVSALEYRDFEMPPSGPLPEEVIQDFRQWIKAGAIDPRDGDKPNDQKTLGGEEHDRSQHWAFQPIVNHPAPPVSVGDWPTADVDRFILSRLESEGLEPNGDADPSTLIRRVYFDLIGLPPPIEVVQSYCEDPSEARFAVIVDSLLASSEFGERWGRHWLDVARYGESAGSSRDVLMLYAWRYRDYVIDAFNRDIPFDRFVTEQLAGDLLSAPDDAERRRLQIATGLLALGSKSLNGGNLKNDIVDDQIDVVSRSILGLTVSCARCHDHKFDPIPTADYYAMAGIFHSTDPHYGGGINRPKNRAERADVYLPLGPPLSKAEKKQQKELSEEIAKLQKQFEANQKKIQKLRKNVPSRFRNDPEQAIPEKLKAAEAKRIKEYQTAFRQRDEQTESLAAARAKLGPEPDYAIGVQDANRVNDAKILIRGEKNQRGETVPRGFLSAISMRGAEGAGGDEAIESIDDTQSGRRQLAAWLVHPDNPLTPRVAVNRIWQHLMGDGLVATAENFGLSGVPPTHPELLDYLAHRFVHVHGWSMKSMIRELVLSRSYRMSSDHRADAYAVDPDNRLHWRMSRRRLEAEPLRDAVLAVSGLLRHEPFDGSLVMQIGEGEVGRGLNTAVLDKPFDHRGVYLPIIRGIVPNALQLFDFPEPSNVQGRRDANTTPKQSLYLMNSPFAIRAAEAFARRLNAEADAEATVASRVCKAHLLCFARPPSDQQIERAETFLAQMRQNFETNPNGDDRTSDEFAWTAYCQTLFASAPFRFVD